LDEKIHAVVNARRSHSSDASNDGKMQFNSTALSQHLQHLALSTWHLAIPGRCWFPSRYAAISFTGWVL